MGKKKYSGIGGQAVMEGIMMRNGNRYAVAVRKKDGEIAVDVQDSVPFAERHKWAKWPIIRGVVAFIESLVIGMKTLMWSSSFFEAEEDGKDTKKTERTEEKPEEKEKSGLSGGEMAFTLIFAILPRMSAPRQSGRVAMAIPTTPSQDMASRYFSSSSSASP